jgi:ABC-type multidrug transport system ATPase subunit
LGENPLLAVLRRGSVRRQEAELQRVARVRLEDLGLGDRVESSADRVSLGQSKRVAISRAVQAGAKILCLDEPLAGVDEDGIREVMGMLRELAQEEQITLVIVAHVFHVTRILDLATAIWTLKDCHISIESPHSVRINSGPSEISEIDRWLQDLGGTVVTHDLAGNALLKIVRIPGVQIGTVVLAVRDLVIYRGGRLVGGECAEEFRGISFEIRQGELALLEAPNGWGKTTLLESLMALVPIHQGLIELEGNDIHKLTPNQRAALGMIFLQSRGNFFRTLSVRDMMKLNQIGCDFKGIDDIADKRVAELSGGERQSLIASCILGSQGLKIALLDEPFLALDSRRIAMLKTSLLEMLNKTASLLLAIPQC